MKALILGLLFLCSYAQADFYSYANGELYLVTDTKAYKVEIVDNKWYTTNQWFPLDQYGYTEEHIQKVKERQAKKANDFVKNNRQNKGH
ncbi:Hypothetical protein DAL_135 [Psychrobacter phage D'Alembert]|nr:Hypothetical protein DAL_135 [Psychrobacter phage D'Alembert]